MIAIFLKLNNLSEEQQIRMLCSDFTALRGEERLRIRSFRNYSGDGSLKDVLASFDLIIYRVDCEKDVSFLTALRSWSPEAKILVIAERCIPPEWYVNSDIMPTELILSPYGPQRISQTIKKLINSIYEDRFEGLHTLRFAVRLGDDIMYIPTKEILYFEARNKKILLKGMEREVLFWGFLKEIQERLPPCFARCHRSIIINTLFIDSINWSLGTILMEDQAVIPFSKKFKMKLEKALCDIAA